MLFEEIKKHIIHALSILYACDSDLISFNSSEWSIVHRLAVYLENEIEDWNIDCEYNRQGLSDIPKVNDENCKIRPDIILHHRGKVELIHNLLAIEVKKNDTDEDFSKVCEYTKLPNRIRKFQYQYGLSIIIMEGPKLKWYKEGEEIS
jgi:hypothetical protein